MNVILFLVCFCVGICLAHCPAGCRCYMEKNLRKASCENRKLTSIENDIPSEVQFLDLSSNVISNLYNYGFKEINLQNLIILNMSRNMIGHIALKAFADLLDLQIVDLSKNILQYIPPEIFEENTHLRVLYLCGNKFYSLTDDPFLESKSLQILDMRACLISHVYESTFSKLPNLIELDISANPITYLDNSIIQYLPKLKIIKSHNITWTCNDKLQNFTDYTMKKGVQFDTPCKVIEKSQKIVLMEESAEVDHEDTWKFKECENIEVLTTNVTKHQPCIKTMRMKSDYILLAAAIFCCGLIVGIMSTYISIKYMEKKRIPHEDHNDECLLAHNNIPMGLSTPILSRVHYIQNME